jgi:hypothetical protein
MKEIWDKTMQEKPNDCARAKDLVAYLYKEATPAEARDFENHMQHCISCRAEIMVFGDVREAIGEWRQQALGTTSSPALASNAATFFASAREHSKQRRSALNALREFFTLSPAWMRAATAAVALVFCTLAIIVVAHFTEQPKVVVVERPINVDSAQENSKVEVGGTSLQPNKTNVIEKDQSLPPQKVAVAVNERPQNERQIKPRATGSQQQQLAKQRRQALPRNNTRPSEELASANDYLPFTAPSREDKLPSLVDLVEEPN